MIFCLPHTISSAHPYFQNMRIMEDFAAMLPDYLYFPSLGDPSLSYYISLMHLHKSVPA